MLNSRSQDNFIYLLKEYNCPEEVISKILKFNDRDFNLLSSRVKDQSDLLTTLIENGYGSEAFKSVFCQKDDEVYNTFVKYKEFIILLLENKCELKSIECVYDLAKLKHKFSFQIKEYLHDLLTCQMFGGRTYILCPTWIINNSYDSRDKIESKFCSSFQSSDILRNAWRFISNQSIERISTFKENSKLFYLIMKNGIINNISLKRLSERDDYKSLNVRDNKQLLDFLLNKELMTLDRAKQGFIADYPLVSSLLKVDALTISELQNNSIEEITQKIETLTKERINKNQEQLGLPLNLSKYANLSYAENEAQSLQTLAVAKVIECLRNKNTFLEAAKVTSVRANDSICAIS